MSEVAIIGAGAWGTALALHAARAAHSVRLWARAPERIGRENPRLPGFAIPREVHVTGVWPTSAEIMLVAVPTQHLRGILAALAPSMPLLLCCKGMEAGTGLLPLEVTAEICPGLPAAVLTGPNFAAEIAAGLPAASVVASLDPAIRRLFIGLLGTSSFRLYGNDDTLGTQLGGAAKNVIAIAAGAVIGAGLGENARAALVTRGLAEISRLVTALGGRADTVAGLSGLGDLLLTCTGPSSRNFAHGFALAQGFARAHSQSGAGTGVVEGVATASALIARAPDTDLPLCRAVADLVAGRSDLASAVAALMARPQRDE